MGAVPKKTISGERTPEPDLLPSPLPRMTITHSSQTGAAWGATGAVLISAARTLKKGIGGTLPGAQDWQTTPKNHKISPPPSSSYCISTYQQHPLNQHVVGWEILPLFPPANTHHLLDRESQDHLPPATSIPKPATQPHLKARVGPGPAHSKAALELQGAPRSNPREAGAPRGSSGQEPGPLSYAVVQGPATPQRSKEVPVSGCLHFPVSYHHHLPQSFSTSSTLEAKAEGATGSKK